MNITDDMKRIYDGDSAYDEPAAQEADPLAADRRDPLWEEAEKELNAMAYALLDLLDLLDERDDDDEQEGGAA